MKACTTESRVKDRHCMECGHDFDEVWPTDGEEWIDPACCPECGSDDTLIAA